MPPYMQHNSKAIDGFGDFSTVVKYRITSAKLENGAYSVAASLTTTFPTQKKGVHKPKNCGDYGSDIATARSFFYPVRPLEKYPNTTMTDAMTHSAQPNCVKIQRCKTPQPSAKTRKVQ